MFIDDDHIVTICGETYLISNGTIKKICENTQKVVFQLDDFKNKHDVLEPKKFTNTQSKKNEDNSVLLTRSFLVAAAYAFRNKLK